MANVLRNLDWSIITDALLTIIPALIVITLHELSHGLVAYKLGDRTAKDMGRLSLNPLRHLDIMGLAMMVIFRFGWAKPVPVDMRNFKNPTRGMALTALAGPVCNFVLSAVFFLLYGLLFTPLVRSTVGGYVLQMLSAGGYLSAALGVFNFIPIPPLDGSKVLFSLVSDETYSKLMRYERYGMIILLIAIWTGVLRRPLNTATTFIVEQFMYIAQWANRITQAII